MTDPMEWNESESTSGTKRGEWNEVKRRKKEESKLCTLHMYSRGWLADHTALG